MQVNDRRNCHELEGVIVGERVGEGSKGSPHATVLPAGQFPFASFKGMELSVRGQE